MDEAIRNAFIESWKAAVQEHDLPAMLDRFGEPMNFASPAIFQPSSDRRYIDRIIGYVAELIEDFTYTAIHPTADGAVMIFSGRCGPLKLEGIDVFRLHPDGTVAELKVFIRPMNALNALAAEMMRRFQADAKAAKRG
jgi:hypothetical protein